jgi:hypothetical protein
MGRLTLKSMNFRCMVLVTLLLGPGLSRATEAVPAVADLLAKHRVPASEFAKILDERDVYSRARLEGHTYSVRNVMLMHAGMARTRAEVTQFGRFAGSIPYIEKSEWDPARKQLLVAGGIWKYQLQSLIQFEEKTPERWEFRIIGGHFLGMHGALEFESAGPGRTLVVFSGSVTGDHFPPQWVIERGAEIVFAVTGRRVRNWVENGSQEPLTKSPSGADAIGVPQPRKRLGGS